MNSHIQKAPANPYDLTLTSFIASMRTECMALWALCLYVFFEYIRPQAMYSFLDILPWGLVSISFATFAALRLRRLERNGTPLDKLFALFCLLVVLSGIFAWDPAESFKRWTTFASWILLYYCVKRVLGTSNRIFLFFIFFLLINFKLSEHGARTFALRGFTFQHWGLNGSPGWFHNSGEFALQMGVVCCLSLCILLASHNSLISNRRWWVLFALFPGTSAVTVIGSSSRGGQIALLTACFFLVLTRRNALRSLLVMIAAMAAVAALLPEEQKARFDLMGEDETSTLRITHWNNAIETIKQHPFGIGYENWAAYYPANFSIERPQAIHNTSLQAFTELGYIGGSVFHLMIFGALIMNFRSRRDLLARNFVTASLTERSCLAAIALGLNLGIIVTLVAGSFMSILYYPVYWFAFATTSALRSHTRRLILQSGLA